MRETNDDIGVSLAALVQAISKVSGNQYKGPMLVAAFKASPHVAEVFQILSGQAVAGCSPQLITKALKRAGYETKHEFVEEHKQIAMQFYLHGTDYCHADIVYDGKKVGTASFVITKQMQAAVEQLRQLGVGIENATIMKGKKDGT